MATTSKKKPTKKSTTKKSSTTKKKNTTKKSSNTLKNKKKQVPSKSNTKKVTTVKNVELPKKKAATVNVPTTKKIDLKNEYQKISSEFFKNMKKLKQKIKKLELKNKIKFVIKKLKTHKKPTKKDKKLFNYETKRRLILVIITILIFMLFKMVPYGVTNYKSEASGKILDIPKFAKLKEECCSYNTTFTSIRSYISLKISLNDIISTYEKLDCDGKDYYYNKDQDFTVTDYGVNKGLIFNTFYISYGNGNSCELDTSFKTIELLPDDYSLEDAENDGCYIIKDNKVINASSYDDFLTDVSNGVNSTLRIVTLTVNDDLIITDLEYLEDGRYKVTYDATRDRNSKNHNSMIAYRYEHIGIYKNKLYAYNGTKITSSMLNTEDVYYLFDVD